MATSDTPQAGRSMPGWLKALLLAALVFTGSWGGTISYWRTTGLMPGGVELLLLLLGLPLLLLSAFWLSRKLFSFSRASSLDATKSENRPVAASVPGATGLAILAAALRSPHGASTEELADVIAGGKARPDLDQELVDEDGFPVMTARSADALDEALQEEITEWQEQNDQPGVPFSEEQWRALTLASAVTVELAGHAATGFLSQPGDLPKLHLIPMLPAGWATAQRRAGAMWLKHVAAQAGWPEKAICLDEEVMAEDYVAAPSAIFNRLGRDAAIVDASLLSMVVACASNIGEQTVADWAANGALFTSSHTKGAIPGEGAAGLLLGDLRQASTLGGDAFAVLDDMDEGRLASSADESRRADRTLLGEIMERALKRVSGDFADVSKIVADTDHRSSRVLELMGNASGRMPQLDGAEDVVQVGVATGSCGVVPFIAALALARHYVLELDAPVLGVSNQDAYHRIAVLVRPAGPLA
jgi:hypothetical protein